MTTCIRCGGPIPALPGQPSGRTFCSVACRTRAKADAARRLLHAITHPDTEADR